MAPSEGLAREADGVASTKHNPEWSCEHKPPSPGPHSCGHSFKQTGSLGPLHLAHRNPWIQNGGLPSLTVCSARLMLCSLPGGPWAQEPSVSGISLALCIGAGPGSPLQTLISETGLPGACTVPPARTLTEEGCSSHAPRHI